MSLPKKVDTLEKYLEELPVEIHILSLDYGFTIWNKKIYGDYNWSSSQHKVNFIFKEIISEIELKLEGTYLPNIKGNHINSITLQSLADKNRVEVTNLEKDIFSETNPYSVISSIFLNKVLCKYNFHSIYEEFQRRRSQVKVNEGKSLR